MRTMYIDKPMRGDGLMQAIARVNRVFRDKPGGLKEIAIMESLIESEIPCLPAAGRRHREVPPQNNNLAMTSVIDFEARWKSHFHRSAP